MTELLLTLTCLGWPVLMMELGPRVCRYLRDREIDRELAKGGW